MEEGTKPEDGRGTGPRRSVFHEWLETLQQESWQLELLISGLALYLIWESGEKVQALELFIEINQGSDLFGDMLSMVSTMAWGSWLIFMLNLLVHILARGLWIGAIGLRYVSGDIDYSHLNYAPIFEKHLSRRVGTFDRFIERLERFCSMVFAYTFLLFFLFLTILVYFGLFVLVISIIDRHFGGVDEGNTMFIGVFSMAYLILGLIYFIDFISLGGLKRIKEPAVARVYFVIYRILNILTLAFLYRPLLYNFIDHRYSRRFLWFSIPYFLVVFLLTPSISYNGYGFFPIRFMDDAHLNWHQNIDPVTIKWAFYEDLRQEVLQGDHGIDVEGQLIAHATLGSYEVDGPYTTLFLRMRPKDDDYLEKVAGLLPIYKKGLRHGLQKAWAKDTIIDQIEEKFDQQRLTILRAKRDHSEQYDEAQWAFLLDSIKQAKLDAYTERNTTLMLARRDSFMNMFQVKVDSDDYSDSLDCRFFFHPNHGERGLLCHMPVQHLSPGSHLMRIERKAYDVYERMGGTKIDTFYTVTIHIPFFKN